MWQGCSWQVAFTGTNSLSRMRKIALQSTENDEVTLSAQNGRTVLVKSLSCKWLKAPLWLSPPGEVMMMTQLPFCDTWVHWYMICQSAAGHRLKLQCWADRECESMRRPNSMALLSYPFILEPSESDLAFQFTVDRPSWEINDLATFSWTFRMVRNKLLLLKPHIL